MHSTEQLHAAAKIIRADGMQGIQSASRIVGRDIALGMLILFLRQSHNASGQWPDAEDTTRKVDELLENAGLLEIIKYSPILGHGVVFDGSGATYVIELEKMYKPESARGVHLGMWMQGPGELYIIPAGTFPFRKAYDEILRAHVEALQELSSKSSE